MSNARNNTTFLVVQDFQNVDIPDNHPFNALLQEVLPNIKPTLDEDGNVVGYETDTENTTLADRIKNNYLLNRHGGIRKEAGEFALANRYKYVGELNANNHTDKTFQLVALVVPTTLDAVLYQLRESWLPSLGLDNQFRMWPEGFDINMDEKSDNFELITE